MIVSGIGRSVFVSMSVQFRFQQAVARTPHKPSLPSIRQRSRFMSTRIVQRLARIALDCPCACDRALAVVAGKLDLGTLAGERSGTKLVEGGTALIKLFAQIPRSVPAPRQ